MTSMMNIGYNVVSLQDWLTMEHNDKKRLLSSNILRYADHHIYYLFMWDHGSLGESPYIS